MFNVLCSQLLCVHPATAHWYDTTRKHTLTNSQRRHVAMLKFSTCRFYRHAVRGAIFYVTVNRQFPL